LFHRFPRSLKFLILKHRRGHWSFAKGHKDKGETDYQTAKRELFEETGIDNAGFLSKKILLKESYNYERKKKRVMKSVGYFVAESEHRGVMIDGNEIIDFKWCTLAAGKKLITYKQSRKLLTKANKIIFNSKKKQHDENQ